LRRTFASILYALGESPAEVMAQLGHTHPGLALRIYASAMRLDEGEKERLRALVDGADWAAMGSESDSEAVGRRLPSPEKTKTPTSAGVPKKRMKGLEPSTFCMASRRSSQLSYIRMRGPV
jgi:hypothetical protein